MPENSEMTKQELEDALKALYRRTFGKEPENFIALRADGSARKIFRMGDGSRSVIGIFGPDPLENRAFLEFSMYFKKNGLPVPEIYAENPDAGIYLEEDLGDTTLFSIIEQENVEGHLSENLKSAYQKVLSTLPRFQEQVKCGMDLTHAYPRAAFDHNVGSELLQILFPKTCPSSVQ